MPQITTITLTKEHSAEAACCDLPSSQQAVDYGRCLLFHRQKRRLSRQCCCPHVPSSQNTSLATIEAQLHCWQVRTKSLFRHPSKQTLSQPNMSDEANLVGLSHQVSPPMFSQNVWREHLNLQACRRHLWLVRRLILMASAIASKRCNSSEFQLGSCLLKGNMSCFKLVSSLSSSPSKVSPLLKFSYKIFFQFF